MKSKIILVGILLLSLQSFSQTEKFDALLKENITDDGVVNYKNINKEELATFINYLAKV